MTSSLIRGRPRRAGSHISVRVAHALLGALAGAVWLVLPGMTITDDPPVPVAPAGSVASAAAPEPDETSSTNLVLPLVVAGAVVVLGAYGYVRRTRRARTRTRTTPGGSAPPPPGPPLTEADDEARSLLVEADEWVRASREELAFAEARFGTDAVAPFARALREAEAELSAAFRMRQRYEDGVPQEETARRQALAGIVGRCREAGRRLDAEAGGMWRLRGLEGGVGEALEVAEGRFRELTGRVGGAEATLAGLVRRYAPSASAAVTGHVEEATDRLVSATAHLNSARQAADTGRTDEAIRHLRAAESAIARADVLLTALDRLATDLRTAEHLVPAALTGAETDIAALRRHLAAAKPTSEQPPETTGPGGHASARTDVEPASEQSPEGTEAGERAKARMRAESAAEQPPETTEPGGHASARTDAEPAADRLPEGAGVGGRARAWAGAEAGDGLRDGVLHADVALGTVRNEVTSGPYDPLAALRRIVQALVPLGAGRAGVLSVAASLVARQAADAAADFVAVHREAVGSTARTRLAEARWLLGGADPEGLLTADALARQAREFAEQDVRMRSDTAAEVPAGFGGPGVRRGSAAPPPGP
ncbi:hypothetical protein ACYF6T_32885 [Streptomyces sp. 7R007]